MEMLLRHHHEMFGRYRNYERAIKNALAPSPADKVTCIMVVGAGRGPLIRCALNVRQLIFFLRVIICWPQAASSLNRLIRVYAVEKNPNAGVLRVLLFIVRHKYDRNDNVSVFKPSVITLRNLKISENWGEMVTIVGSDMRHFSAVREQTFYQLIFSWFAFCC